MRLRSSQFVFFVLLACSVQIGEAYALRLMAGQTLQAAAIQDAAATSAQTAQQSASEVDRPRATLALNPREAAAKRTPRPMPHPASASAAVARHTGLLRA